RVGAIALLPGAVAHYRYGRRARLIVGSSQKPPGEGPQPEHRKVVAGNELVHERSRRAALPPHPHLADTGLESRQLLEARSVIPKVGIERVGEDGEPRLAA